jgi:protein-tyrosine phosphatase
MRRHGHSIDSQRSRPLTEQDLQTFDCILAMDSQNISDIHSFTAGLAIVERFVNNTNVPDPYYGEGDGFERVYEMIDKAAAAWIQSWSV